MTWNLGYGEDVAWALYPDLRVPLVQHMDLHNNEQDSSLAENYCVWQSCDVTFVELPNTLNAVGPIGRASTTHIATGESMIS